eukprot:2674478-Prymnesium_polylepis.1
MCSGSHRTTIRREKRAQRARGEDRGARVRRRIGIRSASGLESLGLSRLQAHPAKPKVKGAK